MSVTSAPASLRWFRSFYWRIAMSFVIVMLAVIVAQSLMFGYMMLALERAGPEPVAEATWPAPPPPTSVPRSKRIAGWISQPTCRPTTGGDLRRVCRDPGRPRGQQRHRKAAAGTFSDRRKPSWLGRAPACRASAALGPALSSRLRFTSTASSKGLVVLPPRRGGVLMTLRRWLSWPGTIVLVAGRRSLPPWSCSRRPADG